MRRVNSLLRLAFASVLALAFSGVATGGVTSSIDQHDFEVWGSTPRELVTYMNNHAFEGDSGRAYANMHPTYSLSLTTKESGGVCRPESVDVHIQLRLTLPAADTSQMTPRTRPLWNNFVAFARMHEFHHRTTYLSCAQEFVQRERSSSAPSCWALTEEMNQALQQMGHQCEAREQPYERSQARILMGLGLFRAAGY